MENRPVPYPRLGMVMKVTAHEPPRQFLVGLSGKVALRDCGRIALEPDEQVTFITDSGAEYDVTRKAWGFYATPSVNDRLMRSGLRAILAKGPRGKFYLLLVERGREHDFERYLTQEKLQVACWLDRKDELERLERLR